MKHKCKNCGGEFDCERSYCSIDCKSKAFDKRIRLHERPLYRVWSGMIGRCHSPSSKDLKRYGGRGIRMCAEWRHSYYAFEEWAFSSGYKKGLWIERKDNNGDYTPENCKFATPKQQARNRKGNRLLTAFGETKTVSEWAEDRRCKVNKYTLAARILRQGLDHLTAITHPAQPFGNRVPIKRSH